MKGTYAYLNEGGSIDEQFIMEECSGHAGDHSDEALEALDDAGYDHCCCDCDAGEWVTVIDGELLDDPNEFHPSHIRIEDDQMDAHELAGEVIRRVNTTGLTINDFMDLLEKRSMDMDLMD